MICRRQRGREEKTGSGFEGTAIRNKPWGFSKPTPQSACLSAVLANKQQRRRDTRPRSLLPLPTLGVPGEEGPSRVDPLLSGKIPACVDFWTCRSVAADVTSFCCHGSMVTSPGRHCGVLGAGSDAVGTAQEMWQQL